MPLELLIAIDMEAMLQTLACEVVGLSATVTEALDLIGATERLDGVMLDLNLRGERVLPVIRALEKRGVPFILVSGYLGHETEDPTLRDARRLAKPFRPEDVADAIRETFLPMRS